MTKVLQGQLNLSNGGLSTDEVIDQLKKYTEKDNDDVAKVSMKRGEGNKDEDSGDGNPDETIGECDDY